MDGDVDRGGGVSDAAVEVEWVPRCLAFRAYAAADGESQRPSGLRVVVQKPLVLRLTGGIVETYQICNPKFQHSEALNPRRFLTTPHTGVLNDGFDNANSDLILSVNFVLTNEGTKQRYIVKKMLGQGTFGQVVKCLIPETDTYVAVKVIKNKPAYYHQALHEVSILKTLNQKYDPEDRYHIVRMLEYFVCQRHLCISFERLGSNLFELLKMNQLKGLSLTLIQMFSKQMLQALVVMKDSGIIHCDLKPENILLYASVKPPRVKIIDFGSACNEGRTVYSYIQSRYYRSPEVVLGYPYTTAIDMWSFGCIIAELFLGLPLFPGSSEYDLLRRVILVLNGQPPDVVLRDAKNTSKYFKHVGSIHNLGSHGGHGSSCAYRFLTEEEYEARELKRPIVGKWYFNGVKLSEIIHDYPLKKTLSEEELGKERIARLTLIDFLRGLLEFDPEKRWTPLQASGHPFVTGNPFSGPYNPPATSSHIPVSRHVTVDYGQGQGHWLAAGLSPQVSNTTRSFRHSSPHFTMAPFTHGGSFGSYNETGCHRGSYGSYGDGNHMYGYYSPGGRSGLCIPLHLGGPTLGNSPDASATHHFPYVGGFGMSPTRTFGPMSLGVSPSQYTPPSTQIQVSNVSPGKYGPTSPARGTVHGSPLGKAAALGQYNKKRNSCPPGTAPVQLPESAPQHWHAHHFDDTLSSYPEASSRGHLGSRTVSSSYQPGWTKQRGNNLSSGSSAIMLQSFPPSHSGKSGEAFLQSPETSLDQAECSSSIPHPGDWDPSYSDELLLQETSNMSTIISGVDSTHLGSLRAPAIPAIDPGFHHSRPNSLSILMNSRTDARGYEFSDADSSSASLHLVHPGQSHPVSMSTYYPSNFPQNYTSRFRQPPSSQFSHVQSALMRDERNYANGQFPRYNYSMFDTHSPASSGFGSGPSWGHQAGYPFVPVPPSSSHSKR